jgi:Predicted membrane protein
MTLFIRYGLNGLFNTAVTYALYLVLIRHIGYQVSIVICYAVGIVLSFAVNRALVFRATGRFARFFLVYVALLLVNIAVTTALVEAAGLGKALAQLPAIGVVFVLGFIINRSFVFSQRP